MENLNIFCRTLFKYKRKTWSIGIHRLFSADTKVAKLNLLFFGNDKFSQTSLQALNEARQTADSIRNIDVVTSSIVKSNPVAKYASENGLKCCHAMTAENIRQGQYDLGIVVSFGHLISEDVIDAFPRGMINVHASLLPRWRGAAPIIYAIMNGDKTTGVSIMTVKPKRFDVGEILAQRSLDIQPNVLMPELHKQLSKLGAELLVECVLNLDVSLKNATPQSSVNVSYAPKIQPAITEIDWNKMSADCIRRRFRALYKFKELTTTFAGAVVRIIDIELEKKPQPSEPSEAPCGSVEYIRSANLLKVRCTDSTDCIFIRRIAVKGKKAMSAKEFTNGYLNKVLVSDRHFT